MKKKNVHTLSWRFTFKVITENLIKMNKHFLNCIITHLLRVKFILNFVKIRIAWSFACGNKTLFRPIKQLISYLWALSVCRFHYGAYNYTINCLESHLNKSRSIWRPRKPPQFRNQFTFIVWFATEVWTRREFTIKITN